MNPEEIAVATAPAKRSFFHQCIASLLVICMFTSCEALNDPAVASVLGGVVGGVVGNSVSKNNRALDTVIGAGVGALVAIAIQRSYQSNQEQRALAEQRARRAWQNERVRASAQQHHAKRCAVAVKNPETGKKNWIITDTDGAPVDNKMYELSSNPGTGKVANVNGHKAVFYDYM